MNRVGFEEYLEGRDQPKNEIDHSIEIVTRYETFLKERDAQTSLENSTSDDIQNFSVLMIESELNTYERYLALARYGLFCGNDAMYLGVLDLLDGAEALDNLYTKVAQEVGVEKRDQIFSGLQRIPLGTPNSEKPAVMQAALERLEAWVDSETSVRILGSGLRDLEDEWYLEERNKYRVCQNIDEYLDQKGRDFISQLEDIKDSGKLFFNQKITEDVIEFVARVPEIRQGVREGDILYEIKIPHMANEYLAEIDEMKKRYYYCHCPWVKESLRSGISDVPARFCNCSAAFHKKPWEVIFEQPLEAEIIESVLQGDLWCKIAIHLPKEVLEYDQGN